MPTRTTRIPAERTRSRAGRAEITIVERIRPRSDRAFLRRVIARTLAARRRAMPVLLLLAGEREIAAIHGRYLGDARGTDVISFVIDGRAEIVVSVERARSEARRRRHPIKHELALYVVHGLLHACGLDDTAARARSRMRNAEREVLLSLGIDLAPIDE